MGLRYGIPYKIHGFSKPQDVPEVEYYPWEDSWVHNSYVRYKVARPHNFCSQFIEISKFVRVWQDFYVFKDRLGFWSKLNTTIPPFCVMHPHECMQYMLAQEHGISVPVNTLEEFVKDRKASCVYGLAQSTSDSDFFVSKESCNMLEPKLFLNLNTKFYDDQEFILNTMDEVTCRATAQNYYQHIKDESAKVYLRMKWAF